MNPAEKTSIKILGNEVELESIENPTLRAVLSSAIKARNLDWNDGHNEGDEYIDWGDKQYWDQKHPDD